MTEREILVELLDIIIQPGEKTLGDIADYLIANGVMVLPDFSAKHALYNAVNALADMVNQFGYSTTFRKQDAVCDGGLSALENAFSALEDCGCKVNSNGTINRKELWEFNMELKANQALTALKALKEREGI